MASSLLRGLVEPEDCRTCKPTYTGCYPPLAIMAELIPVQGCRLSALPARSWLHAIIQPATFLGLFLIIGIWIAATYVARVQLEQRVAQAHRSIESAAFLAAEIAVRTISEADKTIEFVRRLYALTKGNFDLGTLKTFTKEGDPAFQITIVGPDGRVKFSNISGVAAGLDLSDRQHFRVHADGGRDRLFVSRPVIGRVSGRSSVQVSRPIWTQEGAFDGVVVVSLAPPKLIPSNDTHEEDENVILVGEEDGVVRAASPKSTVLLARNIDKTLAEKLAKVPGSRGSFPVEVPEHRGPDVVSFRRIPDLGLVVIASASLESVYNQLAQLRFQLWIGAGSSSILVVLGIVLSAAARAKLVSAQAFLSATQSEARQAAAELSITLEHMNQGLIRVDRTGQISYLNSKVCALLKIEREVWLEGPAYRELCDKLRLAAVNDSIGITSRPELAEIARCDLTSDQAYLELFGPADNILAVRTEWLPDGGFVQTLSDVTARRRAEANVAYLATHDPLTDVLNRFGLFQELGRVFSQFAVLGEHFAVLYIDLDRFKPVNDMFGHSVGDQLLQLVAVRLKQCASQGVVARIGGDEFCVVHGAKTGRREATALASYIIESLGEPFDVAGQQISISASVGVALAPSDGTDANDLLQAADVALSRAKSQGKACFRFFDREMLGGLSRADLRAAVNRGDLMVHYQPMLLKKCV